jgi:pimeloyl-ACP methyl ester carboxylesterase
VINIGPDRLAVWRRGDGPPVVLLHGWLCDHQDMDPLADLLGTDHDVVSMDLRGHGASGTPSAGFGLADFAVDVVTVVEQLELGPVMLLGHSLGAAIALEVAGRAPEVVRGIVIVDSQWTMTRPPAELVAAVWDTAGDDFAQRRRRSLDLRQILMPGRQFPTPGQPVAAEALNALMAWDGPAALRACGCPVHSIVTDANWPTVEPILPTLADLDAFSVSRISGTGHWAHFERPDTVAAALRTLEDVCTPASY